MVESVSDLEIKLKPNKSTVFENDLLGILKVRGKEVKTDYELRGHLENHKSMDKCHDRLRVPIDPLLKQAISAEVEKIKGVLEYNKQLSEESEFKTAMQKLRWQEYRK